MLVKKCQPFHLSMFNSRFFRVNAGIHKIIHYYSLPYTTFCLTVSIITNFTELIRISLTALNHFLSYLLNFTASVMIMWRKHDESVNLLHYYKIGSNRNLLFIALQSAVGILITIQSK